MHVVHESGKKNPLNGWNEDEVKLWLEHIAGEKIARAAKAAGVNGRVLQELDSAAWTELGVTEALRRCKLAAAVREAADGKEPSVAFAVRPSPTVPSRLFTSNLTSATTDGDRHRIQCRCAIQNLNIHNFADSQTFEAFIKFEASWEDNSPILHDIKAAGFDMDDRVVQKKCTYNKLVVLGPDGCECSELFAPRIMFKNRVKEPKSKEEWYSLSKWTEEKPTVRWFCHFTGVFNMREASLRKFPLDEQMLTIEVQTGWPLRRESLSASSANSSRQGTPSRRPSTSNRRPSTPDRAQLRKNPSADAMQQQQQPQPPQPPWRLHGVELLKHKGDKVKSVVSAGSQSFAMKNEYRLTEGVFFDAKESEKRDSASGLEFSLLTISVHVRRKSGFWFNNVFLPSWIITSSLLSSYGQRVGDGGRLEVSVTVLLTLTTFKFLVAHKLPDVDYMTLMCVRMRAQPSPLAMSLPSDAFSSLSHHVVCPPRPSVARHVVCAQRLVRDLLLHLRVWHHPRPDPRRAGHLRRGCGGLPVPKGHLWQRCAVVVVVGRSRGLDGGGACHSAGASPVRGLRVVGLPSDCHVPLGLLLRPPHAHRPEEARLHGQAVGPGRLRLVRARAQLHAQPAHPYRHRAGQGEAASRADSAAHQPPGSHPGGGGDPDHL